MLVLKTLLETPTFAISHDAPLQCLYVVWRGPHDVDSSLTNCALILHHVRDTKAHLVLNDSSLVLDGWSEVTNWLAKAFFPALADHGVLAIAWVKALDWPARAAIEQTLRNTTRPVVDTFEDTFEALTWLCAIR